MSFSAATRSSNVSSGISSSSSVEISDSARGVLVRAIPNSWLLRGTYQYLCSNLRHSPLVLAGYLGGTRPQLLQARPLWRVFKIGTVTVMYYREGSRTWEMMMGSDLMQVVLVCVMVFSESPAP